MKYGYIKVAAATPKIKIGATRYNSENIKQSIKQAASLGAEIIVFGELNITGATCGSMFRYNQLLEGGLSALTELAKFTSNLLSTVVVGLPFKYNDNVYNCSAVLSQGKIAALIPSKSENEIFDDYNQMEIIEVKIGGQSVPFGKNIIIENASVGYKLGIVVGEDFNRLNSDSSNCAKHCANIIINSSAGVATVYSYQKRISKISAISEKLNCAYIYVSGGMGESVSGNVYSGDKIITETGEVITCSGGDETDLLVTEIDIDAVTNSRQKSKTQFSEQWHTITLTSSIIDSFLTREIDRLPFVPSTHEFEEIFDIIGRAIYSRMTEIGTEKVIFGLSGGLDSTMVLIILEQMFNKYKLPLKNIIAVTMRGLGSSNRTQDNAAQLIKALKVSNINIPITDAVKNHLKDIGHDNTDDVVYENAQARERAQILLDLSNKHSALMLGTADLSEIALGWSTYGGDQLAQYNPNSSLSKTMIKAMTRYYTLSTKNEKAAQIISDILSTPISPELKYNQNTEELLGPYEVHDFFIYNLIGKGYSISKLLYMTSIAFPDIQRDKIKIHLKLFINRFFVNQFKRTFGCDGVQVSNFDLSKLNLRSDFSSEQWLQQLESIKD